jgi:hypothetical protein
LSSLLCYVFSSTKLEIRAEQILPGSDGGRGREGGGGGQGREMTQTMYAHVNKRIIKFKKRRIREYFSHF